MIPPRRVPPAAAPEDVRLSSEPEAHDLAHRVLDEGNAARNMAVTGFHDYRPVAILLRDGAGAIRGGLSGWVWARWLYVDQLFVEDDLRGKGWGSRLLAAAESEARSAGATRAFLETFSFQARPFYEERGYEVVGEIEDLPPGSAYFILRKTL